MDWLAVDDVEQIVHLVSQAGDPMVQITVPERKRMLLQGVAELVMADIWFWSMTVCNRVMSGDVMTTSLIDDGWLSDQERTHFYATLSDPKLHHLQARSVEASREHHVTYGREIFALADEQQVFDMAMANLGIGHALGSLYPVDETTLSAIGLYRRLGKPAFSNRDRTIVHVMLNQVDWLHRQGADVPAKHRVLKLSPRERQVMVFLLGGDAIKEVSRKLELSEHTVGDYVKQIYKHFSVTSRAELLSHFIAGGQR